MHSDFDSLSGSHSDFDSLSCFNTQVYTVMKMDALAKLIPFASVAELESIMLDAIRHSAPPPPPPPPLFVQPIAVSPVT